MLFKSMLLTVLTSLSFGSFVSAVPMADKRSSSASDAFPDLRRAAQLSSAAYTGCMGTAFDVTITKQINDVDTDTQGYIGYSTERKTIEVVMRGSTSLTDILNDIDTSPVTPHLSGVSFPANVQVMAGLNRPWSTVHDLVVHEVSGLISRFPEYTLESTGHSLGGALTYMSYIALAKNFPHRDLRGIALAAFPIGNRAFADFGAVQNGTLWRGNNACDGVPNKYIGFPYSYVHYGVEYYSYGTQSSCRKCEGERDLCCSAGNLLVGVTAGHFQSFGVRLGDAGCSSSLV